MNSLFRTFPKRAVVTGLALVLCLAAALAVPRPARAQELTRGLLDRASAINKVLQEKNYHNVGFLRFVVKTGSTEVDRGATLGFALANRLAMAVALRCGKRQPPLGIIRDASAVAARLPGADHRSATGWRELFKTDYPLAFGNKKVQADAFLTGDVELSGDLRNVTVNFLIVEREKGSSTLKDVAPLVVKTNASILAELDMSFLRRGGDDDLGQLLTDKVTKSVLKARKSPKTELPLVNRERPVGLTILYDGKEQRLETKDGGLFVKEPQEGQKVTFQLERRDQSEARYAVVLKVNGYNTLDREDLPDLECRKWVLLPGRSPIEIKGFQIKGEEEAEPFTVLSAEKSRERVRSFYDRKQLGQVSITVFREARPGQEAKAVTEEVAGVERGFPLELPGDLAALRALVFSLGEGVRGLVDGDPTRPIASPLEIVRFRTSSEPVMRDVITYYSK